MSFGGGGCRLWALGVVWGQGISFGGGGHRLEAGDIVWGPGKSFGDGRCSSFMFIFMFMLHKWLPLLSYN